MSVAADDLPIARAYQEELAVRALSQNAILAMDTGTGKTLISVMVLRSKLVAARIKVPQNHRMVSYPPKTLEILTGHTKTRCPGCRIYRPACPTCEPAGEFYSPDDPVGRR